MGIQRSHNNKRFNAILAGQAYCKYGEDMRWTARKALKHVLDRDEFHVKKVNGEAFVGNRPGLNIATRLTGLETTLKEVREEVRCLKIPSEGYKRVRSRFLSNFNRYVRNKFDYWNRNIITVGNIAAHQCDARVDAMLYMTPGPGRPRRTDPDTFKDLYGLQPEIASKISE